MIFQSNSKNVNNISNSSSREAPSFLRKISFTLSSGGTGKNFNEKRDTSEMMLQREQSRDWRDQDENENILNTLSETPFSQQEHKINMIKKNLSSGNKILEGEISFSRNGETFPTYQSGNPEEQIAFRPIDQQQQQQQQSLEYQDDEMQFGNMNTNTLPQIHSQQSQMKIIQSDRILSQEHQYQDLPYYNIRSFSQRTTLGETIPDTKRVNNPCLPSRTTLDSTEWQCMASTFSQSNNHTNDKLNNNNKLTLGLPPSNRSHPTTNTNSNSQNNNISSISQISSRTNLQNGRYARSYSQSYNRQSDHFESISAKSNTQQQLQDDESEQLQLPNTFRQVFNDNGLQYKVEDQDKALQIIGSEDQKKESRMKYYFLPLKIEEQERIIKQNNENILQLQAALSNLLEREQIISTQYNELKQQYISEVQTLQQRHQDIHKQLLEKDSLIQQLSIKLDIQKEQQNQLNINFQQQNQERGSIENILRELEFELKERNILLDQFQAENNQLKEENINLREDKLQLVETITQLEQKLEEKGQKATQLILDRKSLHDDHSIRQAAFISENQQLREQNNSLNSLNKKQARNLQEQKQELAVLKQSVVDLWHGLRGKSNYGEYELQERINEQEGTLPPMSKVNQYLFLLKEQLQTLQEVQMQQLLQDSTKKNEKGGTNNRIPSINLNNYSNRSIQNKNEKSRSIDLKLKKEDKGSMENDSSTFRRQELD